MKYLLITTLLLSAPVYADNWDLTRDEKKVRDHMFNATVGNNRVIREANTKSRIREVRRELRQELRDVQELKFYRERLETQDWREYRANVRDRRKGNKVMQLNPNSKPSIAAREKVLRHHIKEIRQKLFSRSRND